MSCAELHLPRRNAHLPVLGTCLNSIQLPPSTTSHALPSQGTHHSPFIKCLSPPSRLLTPPRPL